MTGLTYRSAGVDLELYDEAMKRLPAMMKRTHTPRVIPLADAFAGLFRLNKTAHPDRPTYDDPILVSGTDGVGTKLKVAQLARRYDTVGIDLVAMSVNDVLCMGAEPLFFLDYLAMGRDNPDLIAALVSGVSDGCQQCGAALMGGETAIMPDLYQGDDFDLAGFCVGVVERTKIIDGSAVRPGDVVIGVPSSGCHSNGYSLIRKVVFEAARLGINDIIPDLGCEVAEALLEPTRLYVKPVLELLKQFPARIAISGLAHITGGGLQDNIARFLPDNTQVVIDRSRWTVPPLFQWLQRTGRVETEEMFHVFNMGIGFTVICREEAGQALEAAAAKLVPGSKMIGHVRAGEHGVVSINS